MFLILTTSTLAFAAERHAQQVTTRIAFEYSDGYILSSQRECEVDTPCVLVRSAERGLKIELFPPAYKSGPHNLTIMCSDVPCRFGSGELRLQFALSLRRTDSPVYLADGSKLERVFPTVDNKRRRVVASERGRRRETS